MISIRKEIRDIETGRMSKIDNPLKNAPHTVLDLIDWKRAYSSMLGLYPAGLHKDKYYCPINRIDNVHGDRHLLCTCPPVDQYGEVAE